MSRLAIVRQKYNPSGGAERIVSAILKQLQGDTRLQTLLINRQWEQLAGVSVCQLNPFYLGSVWRDWGFARAARHAWRAWGAELVQSHERIPGCHVYRADDGMHAAWLAVRAEHAGWRQRLAIAANPYHHYMLRAERLMYRHADFKAVICISEMVKQDAMRYLGVAEQRCQVIYNGIDTEFFHPQPARAQRQLMRQRYRIAEETPLLLCVGSGFERKGVAQALRAIVPHSEVQLVVVGADKKLAHYQRLAQQLGLAQRVHFTGAQSDVRAYYGMADGFILPTIYEPFGLVVAEAMACALPVLTSHRCGAGELLVPGQTGWLAAAADTAAWQANVAAWLAARQHWAQMGAQARQRVEGMSEAQMVAQMLALYTRLLAEGVQ
ncbi:glycosyltransferase family 4 protein [Neisseriaceae bacterium TC5R-5]|nr:glycosyltransferase family 4 protein [Neisseriaceae bacterium TC5R-5]